MTRLSCTVPGCLGKVDVSVVDGSLRETPCPLCARRRLWAGAVLGVEPARKCGICGAGMRVHPMGQQRKYCDACAPFGARLRAKRSSERRRRAAA